MISRKYTYLVCLAFLGLAAVAAHAGTDARLHGKIVDEEGNPVPKATITITTPEQGTFHEVIRPTRRESTRYSSAMRP